MAINRSNDQVNDDIVEEVCEMQPPLTRGDDLPLMDIPVRFGTVRHGMTVYMTRHDLKPNLRMNLNDPEWTKTSTLKKNLRFIPPSSGKQRTNQEMPLGLPFAFLVYGRGNWDLGKRERRINYWMNLTKTEQQQHWQYVKSVFAAPNVSANLSLIHI